VCTVSRYCASMATPNRAATVRGPRPNNARAARAVARIGSLAHVPPGGKNQRDDERVEAGRELRGVGRGGEWEKRRGGERNPKWAFPPLSSSPTPPLLLVVTASVCPGGPRRRACT